MLTTEAAKLAVHTLVTSRLDYCNSLLIGVSKTLITKFQNVQRTSARVIVQRRKYDSITPELISLHWLPVQQRIRFKVLLLVYKAHHKQAPSYISDLLQLQPSRRQLRSSTSSPQFIVPRTRAVTFADRSFSCFGPKEWNTLPNHIKDAQTVNIFKELASINLKILTISQDWCFLTFCLESRVKAACIPLCCRFLLVLASAWKPATAPNTIGV